MSLRGRRSTLENTVVTEEMELIGPSLCDWAYRKPNGTRKGDDIVKDGEALPDRLTMVVRTSHKAT